MKLKYEFDILSEATTRLATTQHCCNLPTQLLLELTYKFLMALEIAFLEKSHRQLCENETIAERKLGTNVAEKLKRRFADLRAATNVKDLAVGKPQEISSAGQQQISVELCDGYHFVFCANHNSNPLLESGSIDWARVSRIKILRIENQNG